MVTWAWSVRTRASSVAWASERYWTTFASWSGMPDPGAPAGGPGNLAASYDPDRPGKQEPTRDRPPAETPAGPCSFVSSPLSPLSSGLPVPEVLAVPADVRLALPARPPNVAVVRQALAGVADALEVD